MEVTTMLCDYAEAIQGKLYIAGGAWTTWRANRPIDASIAAVISVEWNQTNQKHKLQLELLDEDGRPVADASGNPVRIEGDFEAGRPPGVVPGDALVSAFAFRVQGVPLKKGAYKFALRIDGTEVSANTFRVERDSIQEEIE